jgi:SHS2 domain-containing protein
MSYRFVDHTGDFAIELEAADVPGAFVEAARGLLHLLTDAPQSVSEREQRPIGLDAIDGESLLVALGNELLYLFEVEGFLWARLVTTSSASDLLEGSLAGELHGEAFDPERHPIARPFKAVTHHGAELEETGEEEGRNVRARFVVDL